MCFIDILLGAALPPACPSARPPSMGRDTQTAQGPSEDHGVIEPPDIAIRRLPPDAVQLQVLVGSLLGDGNMEGREGARRLRIRHPRARERYAWWKYERLAAFAAAPPVTRGERTTLLTITHPLFDDLVEMDRSGLVRLLEPLGLAVWLTDVGRLRLDITSFSPEQEAALCGSV
jgi:hypothetical protein